MRTTAAAAILAARAFGIRWDDAISALDGATPAFGRMEEIAVGDRSVILTLAKNPASMVQAVNAAAVRHPDALVIALGDRPADGRDVSWIWDTELDRLPVCPLTLTGSRADDLALRFKYGAEDEVRGQEGRPMIVDPTLERAVDGALDRVGKGGTLMILATYTTLLEARNVLRQRCRRLRCRSVNGAGPRRLGDAERVVRIVHLFPDLLSVYGDAGNVRALVVRAEARGIRVTRARVLADDDVLPSADLFVIGGGQDRDQARVASRLRRLGEALEREVGDGAALLAICGGYQSLGKSYRSLRGPVMGGPGLLHVTTVGAPGRLVGPSRGTPRGPGAALRPRDDRRLREPFRTHGARRRSCTARPNRGRSWEQRPRRDRGRTGGTGDGRPRRTSDRNISPRAVPAEEPASH